MQLDAPQCDRGKSGRTSAAVKPFTPGASVSVCGRDWGDAAKPFTHRPSVGVRGPGRLLRTTGRVLLALLAGFLTSQEDYHVCSRWRLSPEQVSSGRSGLPTNIELDTE